MVLVILRGIFVLLAAAVAALYLLPFQQQQQIGFLQVVLMLAVTIFIAAAIVAVDIATRRKRLSSLSGVFLGLIAGLVAAYALSFVVELVYTLTVPQNPEQAESYANLFSGVKVIIGLITCYIGISMVLQTKDDFRFVIPYVEFSKQFRGTRPTLLDTSAIIDGRIFDISRTHVIQGTLIVPRFVLEELQNIADSKDKLRRARGRRGLDVLQKLESDKNVSVSIQEHETEGMDVDQKLINLATSMPARLMTTDFNLNKVATLRGLEVINLNDLTKALRPIVLPGERMKVKVVRPGESHAQGVGYMDDGTMIVIEGGRNHLQETVDVVVTTTLQTSAGKMIFGNFDCAASDDSQQNLDNASNKADDTDHYKPHSFVDSQSPEASSAPPNPPSKTHNTSTRRNPRRNS